MFDDTIGAVPAFSPVVTTETSDAALLKRPVEYCELCALGLYYGRRSINVPSFRMRYGLTE